LEQANPKQFDSPSLSSKGEARQPSKNFGLHGKLSSSGRVPQKVYNKDEIIPTPRTEPYKFTFSSTSDLSGSAVCATLVVLFVTAIYIGMWPALEYYERNYLKDPTLQFTHYYYVMYLLVFNGVLLLWGGRYIASVMAYPYQSCFFSRHLERTTN